MRNFQYIAAIILMLLSANHSTAQNAMSKVNVYAQIGALEATLNLEVRLHNGSKITWYGRAGGGIWGIFPLFVGTGGFGSITMLAGKKNNHFELNGGLFFGYEPFYKERFVFPIAEAGYRYQKPSGGFIFKANIGFFKLGIGMGYAF